VTDVGRELCYEIQMVELPWSAFVPFLLEGVGDRFVVCEDGEVASFQHVVEMLYSLVDGQKLAIVCTIFLLSWVQFFWKRRLEAARRF
jgi:hypothetical protein